MFQVIFLIKKKVLGLEGLIDVSAQLKIRKSDWNPLECTPKLRLVDYLVLEETQLCSIGNLRIWLVLALFSIRRQKTVTRA